MAGPHSGAEGPVPYRSRALAPRILVPASAAEEASHWKMVGVDCRAKGGRPRGRPNEATANGPRSPPRGTDRSPTVTRQRPPGTVFIETGAVAIARRPPKTSGRG